MINFIELGKYQIWRVKIILYWKFLKKNSHPYSRTSSFSLTFYICLLLAVHAKGHISTAPLVKTEQLAGQLVIDLYTINFYIDK